MRAVVHVGMPKTGSTAIQAAFHGWRSPQGEYLDGPGINHYGMLLLLYEAGSNGHHVFWPKRTGHGARVEERRELARDRFEAQVARVAAEDGILVVSSEALWATARAPLREALVADLAQHGARTEALAYLRPALSYATSAFQQRLKHFDVPPAFGLEVVWPRFRAHVASLDRSFGPSAVRLRPFRTQDPRFDVVDDFAASVGVGPVAAAPARSNASLSAEAIAVLYAARRRVPRLALASRAGHRAAAELLDHLRGLGSSALAFAETVWAPLAAAHADDLRWAEGRLGHPLTDEPSKGALVIASERELLDLAEAHAASDQAQAFAAGLERLAAQATVPTG